MDQKVLEVSAADTLQKPDMVAVLERTHVAKNLHGFLLPTLEAVSNSLGSVETRFESTARKDGRVEILISSFNDPESITITVTDNGVGLNDANYDSFKTPFSGFKLKQGGRGFGRFIAFKVFADLTYCSRHENGSTSEERAFKFDVNAAKEIVFVADASPLSTPGLRVKLSEPLSEWRDLIKQLDKRDVADHIASHFLPHCLYGWLPEITLCFDDGDAENITTHFEKLFVQSASGDFKCSIEGVDETIQYSITKNARTRSFKNHCLLFAAGNRIVGSPRDLSALIGQASFIDANGQAYIIIAVVRSPAFESRLNDARTSINIAPATIEEIVSTVSTLVQSTERDQIFKIKTSQSAEVEDALRQNPILRIGLRGKSVQDYVSGKPNNWRAQEFVSNLAVERFRSSRDLQKAITSAASDPASYTDNIKSIVAQVDESNKEALAEYVVHRSKVIELVEAARRYGTSGARAPEDTIHDLVFRRFSDSVEMDYFDHNLWLIDDALAFMPYISSDRAMHGKGRKKGDKIPDLSFFDDSLVLGDQDGTTITIVEFKKPSRNDYKVGDIKFDPVMQVVKTLEDATAAGGIAQTDGAHFAFRVVVRRFGYIVADITPTLVSVLKSHDFRNDWNPEIYVRYRDNEKIFIQASGYDTMIANAKKRNQAFFSVLFGE